MNEFRAISIFDVFGIKLFDKQTNEAFSRTIS